MINQTQSLVTIGIPLYNEENYIEEAIRSAASQCETVWVSDNASTDGSAAICEMLSREYPNVHFVRQPRNMGAKANFKFLMDKADTPYFMWLGSHDALIDGYVLKLSQLLEDCPEAILAYGGSRHVNLKGKQTQVYDYHYYEMLADKMPATRIMGLIRYLSNCSLVHGVFRTEALRAAWDDVGPDIFIGADHVFLGHAAIKGPFLYAPETYLIRRDVHPEDTPQELMKRIDPYKASSTPLTYHELERRQFAQAATVSKGTGLPGLLYRFKARVFLVKRFGPFGESFLMRKLDTFLFLLVSPLSNLPRNLLNMVRYGFSYRVQKLKHTLCNCWKAK